MGHTFYEVSCNRLEAVCSILCQSLIDFRYSWQSDTVSFVLADDDTLKIDRFKMIGHGFTIRSSFSVDCASVHSVFSK